MSRTAALHQAASLLLTHPDEDWRRRLDLVRGALDGLPGEEPALLRRFCGAVAGVPQLEMSARYVATFDRSRRRALYLTYSTDGDTRRRGARPSYVGAGSTASTAGGNAPTSGPPTETVGLLPFPTVRPRAAEAEEVPAMAGAPLVYQVHALPALALFALWPFSRLVHAFTASVGYLTRPYVVYRSRGAARRQGMGGAGPVE